MAIIVKRYLCLSNITRGIQVPTMDNRKHFNKLLADNGLTQADGAALICDLTQRPLSVRTVRSWLNDPEKPSSRPCPDWAVDALKKAINKAKK